MARITKDVEHKYGLARIPSKIRFPFGYTIIVKQMTNSNMNALDKDCDGLWDSDSKTIYIRKSLQMTRKRYILTHELGHAFLDWQHLNLDEEKATV